MCQITCETIVQCATILSPIIAVGLAYWTIRSSSKDTDKKIAAIEEGTKKQIDAIEKQIESIKQLAKLQAEIASTQLEKELLETHFRLHKLSGKQGLVLKDNRETRQNLDDVNLEEMSEEERAKYQEEKFFDEQLSNLERQIKYLDKLKKEAGLIYISFKR